MGAAVSPVFAADVMQDDLLLDAYRGLLAYYGDQSWWPAETSFEVMVGAILTQNTAWSNVEKAISNLKQHELCHAEGLATVDQNTLAVIIRSSGYFNQKAERLILFSRWYVQQGGYSVLNRMATAELRDALLGLKGIGDETADDMVLYAFERPSFVIDSYTRRIFSRLGLLQSKQSYHQLQQLFHQGLQPDVALFKQYHALIVCHAKRHCRKQPSCSDCPLQALCRYRGGEDGKAA